MGIKLYDIIIREFPGDSWMEQLAKALSSNPLEAGISEEKYRETCINTLGYDPTTIYDFDRIDKCYDDNKDVFVIPEHKSEDVREELKRGFVEAKDQIISNYVKTELSMNYPDNPDDNPDEDYEDEEEEEYDDIEDTDDDEVDESDDDD